MSQEKLLGWYMRMPWTIRVERREDCIAARIDELPGFAAAGANEDEFEENLWEALESHLRSYLDHDEDPPMPGGVQRPRERALERTPKSEAESAGDSFVEPVTTDLMRQPA